MDGQKMKITVYNINKTHYTTQSRITIQVTQSQ